MLGAPPARVDEIASWLRAFRDAGVDGLPVGPAGSALLADAVLAAGDDALRSTGASFVRWVDDVAIFAPDRRARAAALGALREAWASLGLEMHEQKTVLLDDPRDVTASAGTTSNVALGGLRAAIIAPREDPLPRRARAHALVPADRRVGPDRRPPRPARGQRRPAACRPGGRPSGCDDHARVHRHARPPDADGAGAVEPGRRGGRPPPRSCWRWRANEPPKGTDPSSCWGSTRRGGATRPTRSWRRSTP